MPDFKNYLDGVLKTHDPKYTPDRAGQAIEHYNGDHKKLLADLNITLNLGMSDDDITNTIVKYNTEPIPSNNKMADRYNGVIRFLESSNGVNTKNPSSSAVGDYQHMWSKHKDPIKSMTGITDPEEYRKNIGAQTKYQNHLLKGYMSNLPSVKKLAEENGVKLHDEELVYLMHHHGIAGAKDYLKGIESKYAGADDEFNQAIVKLRNNPDGVLATNPVGGDNPKVKAKTEQKAAKQTDDEYLSRLRGEYNVDLNKALKEAPPKKVSGRVSPKTNKVTVGRDDRAIKLQLLQSDKYAPLVDTPEKLQRMLDPEYDATVSFTTKAANKIASNLEKDANNASNSFLETIGGGYDIRKDKSGNVIVNLNPYNDVTNLNYPFAGTTTNKPMYYTKEEILRMDEHPDITKAKNSNTKMSSYSRQALQQYLLDVKAELTKSDRMLQKLESSKQQEFLNYLSPVLENVQNQLESKYGKLDEVTADSGILKDPLYAQYQEYADRYNKTLGDFNAETPRKKIIGMYNSSTRAIEDKYDQDMHSVDDLVLKSIAVKGGRMVGELPEKLGDVVTGLPRLAGVGVDALTGSDLATTSVVSSSLNAKKLRGSNETGSIFTRIHKTNDNLYAEYDDQGEIVSFKDKDGYTISYPGDPVFEDLVKEEIKINPNGDTVSARTVFGYTTMFEGIREGVTDMAPIIAGGAISKVGTAALSKLAAKRLSRVSNGLARLANNDRFLTIAGSYMGFTQKIMDGAIESGGVNSSTDIFATTALKTGLEAAIEALNPLEGMTITGKLFNKLNARQVNDLVRLSHSQPISQILPKFLRYSGATLKDIAKSGAMEGIEEVAASVLEPLLNAGLNNALNTKYSTDISLDEAIEAGLIGAGTGMIFSAGPAFISNASKSNSQTLRSVVKNPELFNKLFNGLVETETARINESNLSSEQKALDIQSLNDKAEAIRLKHNNVVKATEKLYKDGNKFSNDMQLTYTEAAWTLEDLKSDSKGFTEIDGKKIANETLIKNYERVLKEFDTLVDNNFEFPFELSSLAKGILNAKQFEDRYQDIKAYFDETSKVIASKDYNENQKVKLLKSVVQDKMTEIKTSIDESARKKEEDQKAKTKALEDQIIAERTRLAEEARVQKLKDIEFDVVQDSDFFMDEEEISLKYDIDVKDVKDILSRKDQIRAKTIAKASGDIYSNAAGIIKNIQPGSVTKSDIDSVLSKIEEDVMASRNIPESQKSAYIQRLNQAINRNFGKEISAALKREEDLQELAVFDYKVKNGDLAIEVTEDGEFVNDEGTWRHVDKDKYGEVASDELQDKLNEKDAVIVYNHKGKNYQLIDGKWYTEDNKLVTNTKGIQDGYEASKSLEKESQNKAAETVVEGVEDEDGYNGPPIPPIPVEPPFAPMPGEEDFKLSNEEEEELLKDTQEKAAKPKRRINDALYEAYLDSQADDSLDEDIKDKDAIIRNLESHGLTREQALQHIEKTLKERSQKNNSKSVWLKNLAEKNKLNTYDEYIGYLNNNVETSMSIDIDFAMMYFSSSEISISDNKVTILNKSRIGDIPFTVQLRDKGTSRLYYTYLHNESYFDSVSDYEGDPATSSVDKSSKVLDLRLEVISESLGVELNSANIGEYIAKVDSIENDTLRAVVQQLKNEYYVVLPNGKLYPNITIQDYKTIIREYKEFLYEKYDDRTIGNYELAIEDITNGTYDWIPNEGYVDVSTIPGIQLKFLKSDTGNISATFKLMNNKEGQVTALSKAIEPELRQYLINLIKFYATDPLNNNKVRTPDGKNIHIRDIIRFFTSDVSKLPYHIRLEKGSVVIKMKDSENAVVFNQDSDLLTDTLNAYFNSVPNYVIKRYLMDTPFFKKEAEDKDNILLSDVVLMHNGKEIFNGAKFKTYDDYLKTVTKVRIKSTNTFQNNMLFRPIVKKGATIVNDDLTVISPTEPTIKKSSTKDIADIERRRKEELIANIYAQLGDKTVSRNVILKSVYQQAGINFAKSIGGIFSLRVNNSNKHFGNPFSSVPSEIAKGLIATKSTKESVEKYIGWVLFSNEERAKWIREQIKSGNLKNKPIIYYKELGEPSHATALDYLINAKYDAELDALKSTPVQKPSTEEVKPNTYNPRPSDSNVPLPNVDRPDLDTDDIDIELSYSESSKEVKQSVIQEDLDWLSRVLPQLSAVEVEAGTILNNNDALAAFVSSLEVLDDFGSTHGIYYTNRTTEDSERSQIRHEAFEAVWGLYVPQQDKAKLLEEAKSRYPKPTKAQLAKLRELYNISEAEAIDKYYKESMADEFNNYQYKKPSGLIETLFNKLKDLITYLLGNRTLIDSLFKRIENNKFSNQTPVNTGRMLEYSSQPTITKARILKISKNIARLLFQAKRKDGSYVFLNFDKVNSKNINNALVINPTEIAKHYRALTKIYENTIQDPNEKLNFQAFVNSIINNIDTRGIIYDEIITQINNLYNTDLVPTEDEITESDDYIEDDTSGEYNMASYEKNYKANQYPIIRSLLSSIVKKSNGTVVLDQETYLPQLVPYDKVVNTLLRYLSNKYTGVNDINEIIADIEKLSKYRDEFSFLYNRLVEWNSDPSKEYLVKQFVTSLVHERLNFSNVLFRNNSIVIQDISKDASDGVVSKWASAITDYFTSFSTGEALTKLQGVIDKAITQKGNLKNTKTVGPIEYTMFTSLLRSININIDNRAVQYYIEELDKRQDKTAALDDLYTKFLYLLTDETDTSRSIIDLIERPDRFKTNNVIKFVIDESAIKALASAHLFFDDSLHESVVVVGNKKVWLYALPSFIQQQLIKLKKGDVNKLSAKAYHRNSVLLKAIKNGFDPSITDLNVMTLQSERIDLNNSRLVEDQFASLIAHNNGDTKPLARLLSFNSHRRNNIYISLPKNYQLVTGGKLNPEVIDILRGYVYDEFDRYLAFKANPNNFKNLSKNYGENFIFPELSENPKESSTDPTIKALEDKIRNYIYKVHDKSLVNDENIDPDIITDINLYIDSKIRKLYKEEMDYYQRLLAEVRNIPMYNFRSKLPTMVGNAMINSIIGGVETMKLFMGDPAQYGGLTDITKRTHSITSSGIYFETPYDLNYAVISTLKGPSDTYTKEYVDDTLFQIRKKELTAHFQEGNLRKMPSDEDIRKQIAKVDYSNVDKTDAYAEMTLPFWKDMLNSIGRWNPIIHDPIYEKLLKGEATNEDIIGLMTTLQPVKTVGFALNTDLNDSFAMATYLKWSQFVMHPASVGNNTEKQKRYNVAVYGKEVVDYAKDTPLDIKDQVHFYQYDSSSKATNDRSKYISNNTNINEISAAKQVINSTALKIQQDLSAKSIKKNEYDEPSQTRKNIFQNILYNKIYKGLEGSSPKTGLQILDEMSKVDRESTNRKHSSFIEKLGYKFGIITKKDSLSEMLLEEFSRRSISDDLFNYISAGNLDLNKVPQFKALIENKLSSMIRSKVIKSKLFGNSFIQIPEVGMTTALKDATTDFSEGIKGDKVLLLNNFTFDNDTKKLKGPSIKDGAYRPSLVFLPSSFVKNLPRDKRTPEYLNELLLENPKLFKGIGSRIPNQGGPSIDSFEIAGILPSYMGDSMVVYEDITQKYGSDYDIDKMYVSMYAYTMNKETGEVTVDEYFEDPNEEQNSYLYSQFINSKLFEEKYYVEFKKEYKDLVKLANKMLIRLDELLAEETQDEDLLLSFKDEISLSIESLRTESDEVLFSIKGMINTLKDLPKIPITKEINEIKDKATDILYIMNNIKSLVKKDNPYSEFVLLPTEAKHSFRALKNRKMDLYRQVLESEYYHYQNISPLDNSKDDIRNSIHEVYGGDPVNYRKGLGFFTSTEQTKIKSINVLSKASLGLAANSGVDLVKARRAGMYYNLPLHEELFINLSKIFTGDSLPVYISEVIAGGYLSAFVDAEKDPYIIFGNINKFTYPIVDLLVKAGYTAPQIIRFMTQPVISKVIRNQFFESPLFGSDKPFTAIELTALEYADRNEIYNFETEELDFKAARKFLNVLYVPKSTSDLADKFFKATNNNYINNASNYIKTGKELIAPATSLEILYLFNQLKNHSKVIADTITSVKQDVNGSGATFNDAFANYETVRRSLGIETELMENLVEQMQRGIVDEDLVDLINAKSPVKNYINKFLSKTQEGYIPNADGTYFLVSSAFLKDLGSSEVITQHPKVKEVMYRIGKELSNFYLTNSSLIKKIQDDVYTYTIVRSIETLGYVFYGKQSKVTKERKGQIFKGTDTLVDKLFNPSNKHFLTLRNTIPTFISMLEHQSNLNEDTFKFLATNNFRSLDDSTLNVIHSEMKDLYEYDLANGTTFMEDIVLYELYANGFSYNAGSIINFIPVDFTSSLIDYNNLVNVLENDIDDFYDQFYYSNFDSEYITSYNVSGLAGTNKTYKPYISSVDKDGNKILLRLDSFVKDVNDGDTLATKPKYVRVAPFNNQIKILGSTTFTIVPPAPQPLPDRRSVKKVDQIHYENNIIRDIKQLPLSEINYQEMNEYEDTELPFDPSSYKNFSGGAEGADLIWDQEARKIGIETTHFTVSYYDTLTEEEKQTLNSQYLQTTKFLGRGVLKKDTYSGKLVRRDMIQANSADAVFAITELVKPTIKGRKGYDNKMSYSIPEGGTGYAVARGILSNKPTYVFNQSAEYGNEVGWYMWDESTKDFVPTSTPTLTNNFAGIGTREINDAGKQAIRDVFNTLYNNDLTQDQINSLGKACD